MKILKLLLIIVVAIVVLALVIALFIPKDMKAEREIVIDKPKQQVFDYIKLLANQNNYSKWATMDPNMKKEFKGTDGTPGFVSAWESSNGQVGKGEQTITTVVEGERMESDLHFIKPFESTATCFMSTEAMGDSQTKVKWGFQGRMNYPLNIMRLFMNPEKSVGDDFATGLSRLKTLLEQK